MTKKKSEHDVFQLIANEQHETQEKRGNALAKRLDMLSRKRTAWLQTGIQQMWDDVKHIEVKNFARGYVAGETAPLADFVVLHSECNVYGHGLALWSSRANETAYWEVAEGGRTQADFLYLTHTDGKVESGDALRQCFIKWLARKIDARVIADLGYTAKEIKPPNRRILVEAQT